MNISLLAVGDRVENYTFRLFKALLESKGHNVRLIYLNIGRLRSKLAFTDSLKMQLIDLIRHSELVGLYVFTFNFSIAAEITRYIKDKTDSLVIWGGPHAIAEPAECCEYADIVCFREGEEALLEIVERFQREGKAFKKDGIPNIAFMGQEGARFNNTKKLGISLDTLPFQDISFDDHYYVDERNNIAPLSYDIMKKNSDGIFFYITMISRGCPFKCSFCLNSNDNSIPFSVGRSVDNVISELKQAKNRFPGGIDEVMFYDDDFYALPVSYIKEFSEKFRAQIGLPLHPFNASATNFSEEKFLHLKRAGSTGVICGIQTISKNGRAAYGNPATKEKIRSIVEVVKRYPGTSLIFHLILGNPYETLDDTAENFLFLDSLPKIFALSNYQLVIYPGTKLYERVKNDKKFQIRAKEGYTVPYYASRPELRMWNYLVRHYFLRQKDLPRSVTFLLRHRLYSILGFIALNHDSILGFIALNCAVFHSVRNDGMGKTFRKIGNRLTKRLVNNV